MTLYIVAVFGMLSIGAYFWLASMIDENKPNGLLAIFLYGVLSNLFFASMLQYQEDQKKITQSNDQTKPSITEKYQ